MTSERATIMIVDDEPTVTDLLSTDLELRGYNCVTAATGEDALVKLATMSVDALLLDLRLPGVSGMDVLTKVVSSYPATVVIIMTAVEDPQTVVQAMKIGALDYMLKPFELEIVADSIRKALRRVPLRGNKAAPHGDSTETSNDEVDWAPYLDDIACGVAARYELLTDFTRTLIGETLAIARSLGIPENQIEKWANARQEQNTKKVNAMDSLSKKLERNPIAQVMLGATELHQCDPNANSLLN